MAKELMEIGGFITEGAEIVNHDASLSGNGTVDSPLGVVPSYNETVLYNFTGAGYNQVTAVTLSEPATHFDRLRLYGIGYANTPFIAESPAPATITSDISFNAIYYCHETDGNPLQMRFQVFSSTDAITYRRKNGKFLYWTSTGTTPAGTNNNDVMSVTKIVGINRKV